MWGLASGEEKLCAVRGKVDTTRKRQGKSKTRDKTRRGPPAREPSVRKRSDYPITIAPNDHSQKNIFQLIDFTFRETSGVLLLVIHGSDI